MRLESINYSRENKIDYTEKYTRKAEKQEKIAKEETVVQAEDQMEEKKEKTVVQVEGKEENEALIRKLKTYRLEQSRK